MDWKLIDQCLTICFMFDRHTTLGIFFPPLMVLFGSQFDHGIQLRDEQWTYWATLGAPRILEAHIHMIHSIYPWYLDTLSLYNTSSKMWTSQFYYLLICQKIAGWVVDSVDLIRSIFCSTWCGSTLFAHTRVNMVPTLTLNTHITELPYMFFKHITYFDLLSYWDNLGAPRTSCMQPWFTQKFHWKISHICQCLSVL